MADIQMPFSRALFPESASFGLQTRVLVSIQSELSASVKRIKLPGDRWVCEVQYNGTNSDRDQQAREALYADLGGQQNNLLLWHPRKLAPMGSLRGTPEVQSTSNPKILNMRNAASGQTFLAGDMIKANNQLFMVTKDGYVGASVVPVHVAPARRAPFDWTTLLWDKPTAKFILDGNEVLVPYSPGRSGGDGFAVRFVEVF